MKTSDIILQVNRDLDEDYGNGDIIDWINRCIDDLAPIAKKEAQTSFTITTANSYALPIDFLEMVDVLTVKTDLNNNKERKTLTQLQQRDYDSVGYKVWGNALSTQNALDTGSIDVYYYKKPAYLSTTNLDAVPDIEESYHDLFILYAIGHMQFTEEDYDDRQDMLQRYYQRKAEYEAFINRKNMGQYQIRVVDW